MSVYVSESIKYEFNFLKWVRKNIVFFSQYSFLKCISKLAAVYFWATTLCLQRDLR